MKHVLFTFTCLVALSACGQTTTSSTNGALPSPFRLVGEPGLGAMATAELTGDGIAVSTDFVGRRLGITAFCSGNADALILGNDFTSDERATCKSLGGSWSAFTTQKGAGFYVRHDLAQTLLDTAKNTFL